MEKNTCIQSRTHFKVKCTALFTADADSPNWWTEMMRYNL